MIHATRSLDALTVEVSPLVTLFSLYSDVTPRGQHMELGARICLPFPPTSLPMRFPRFERLQRNLEALLLFASITGLSTMYLFSFFYITYFN